jgi:hypothetical protein
MQVGQGGKEGGPMLPKISEERFVLAQAQVHPDHLPRKDFTICQGWLRSPLAQRVFSSDGWQQIVKQTKPCDYQVIQVHRFPPQKRAWSEQSKPHDVV